MTRQPVLSLTDVAAVRLKKFCLKANLENRAGEAGVCAPGTAGPPMVLTVPTLLHADRDAEPSPQSARPSLRSCESASRPWAEPVTKTTCP